MAKPMDAEKDSKVTYWGGELERAKKRYQTFWANGDNVVDAYRQQKADNNDMGAKDKFNILYSSTETIRPNLYGQTPKVRVVLRSKDTATPTARVAAQLIEGNLAYLQQECDFDEVMDCVVEDFMLPGLGTAWVMYNASFGDKKGEDGQPILKEGGKPKEYEQELLDEMVEMEYVYWQDFLTGVGRTWKQVPWVSKRVWLTKEKAAKRFGKDTAAKLNYATRDSVGRDADNPSETAEVWEIWERASKRVYWFSDDCATLLDEKEDPLKLKRFFPCPRPLRAISNTRTFVPRALYSQYKSQAETLNVMTKRIRLLSEALKVVGFYDGANPKLADALNPSTGNKMIAVDGWAMFAQAGGIAKSVDWVPLDTVVKVLNELLQAREVCKQEIYEITGFSDIVRGVSKASETLGAQNLKANWAGARVKKMQAEVQRFARDLLALAGELVAEHCSPETIAVFSGIEIPPPAEVQASADLQQQLKTFTEACALIRNEMRRLSTIDIETDSTLLADETAEREDRTKFLAGVGAFLQQAVPAMEATPEMGPLLGELLMFTVRTFPSSRGIEDVFEKVQQSMAARAANPDQDKNGEKAKAAAETQKAQAAQAETALKQQEVQAKAATEAAKLQNDAAAETNRHSEKMLDLQIRQQELALKDRELAITERNLAAKEAAEAEKVRIAKQDADTRAQAAADGTDLSLAGLEQEDAHHEDEIALEAERLEAEERNKEADRAAQAEAAANKPPGGSDDA